VPVLFEYLDLILIIRRNERLPFVPPADYWKDTPMKPEGQLSEKVIVRAHDLQVQSFSIVCGSIEIFAGVMKTQIVKTDLD
jgi:hypothetical protein